MKLSELFGKQPEPEEPEVEETPTEPAPQYATVEQMQQMISGVAERLQENLVGYVQGGQQQQPQQQQPTYQPIQAPSLDEIAEAWEEGETKKALQMQAQREAALEQKFNQQLQAVYREGQNWVSTVNDQIVDTAVPDYKKYKKEADELMDNLGIPRESRSNQLRKLVTDSIKGSKIDEIFAERMEAAKRQENLDGTAEPSGHRSNPVPAEKPKVFSDDAMLALQANGIDLDTYARKRGHGTREEYEKAAAAYQAAKRGEGTYVPKWRRNKN